MIVSRHGELTRPAKGTGYVMRPSLTVRFAGRCVNWSPNGRIKVHFRDSKGNDIKTVEGNEGDDLLSLAHEWDVDLEGESGVWGLRVSICIYLPSILPGILAVKAIFRVTRLEKMPGQDLEGGVSASLMSPEFSAARV